MLPDDPPLQYFIDRLPSMVVKLAICGCVPVCAQDMLITDQDIIGTHHLFNQIIPICTWSFGGMGRNIIENAN